MESAIIGTLLFGVALGGTVSTLSVPPPWASLSNPAALSQQYNLTSFALYYGNLLGFLGSGSYGNVSFFLGDFGFLNFPTGLAGIAGNANSEIASMNDSIPLALIYLNETQYFVSIGLYSNASLTLREACLQSGSAASNLNEFENSTTPQFASQGVPVSEYSSPLGQVRSVVQNISGRCASLTVEVANLLSGGGSNGSKGPGSYAPKLSISSNQTDVETGGYLSLSAKLTNNSAVGLRNQVVTFYVNSTFFGSGKTNGDGVIFLNSTIPFVYEPLISAWAVVQSNASINTLGAVSNTLYFKVLFNQTNIIINDPASFLPTQNFTVSGLLSTASGIALPNAPVKITSFNEAFFTQTNTSGTFTEVLTVPANATDGMHYIYAAFAPQGAYGPSTNFTSIIVTHEALNLSLDKIPLSISGLHTLISGHVSANGSALESNVTIISPWGNFETRSDSSGVFRVSLPVPVWEFASSKEVTVSALPAQPYINAAKYNAALGIVNPLEIALPIILAGAVLYEAKSLDLLPKLKRSMRKGKKQDLSFERAQAIASSAIQVLVGKKGWSALDRPGGEVMTVFRNALALAVMRFEIVLRESLTIREIVGLVEKDGGSRLFSRIAALAENYLYSEHFDVTQVVEAKKDYNELQLLWKRSNRD